MEMSIIISGVALVFAIIYRRKKVLLISTIFLAIALSLFAFYNYALAIDFPEIKVMQEAEHEFIDRENIDLWTLDDKERIKNLAMRFFVVDTAIFDHEDYIAAVNIPT